MLYPGLYGIIVNFSIAYICRGNEHGGDVSVYRVERHETYRAEASICAVTETADRSDGGGRTSSTVARAQIHTSFSKTNNNPSSGG